MIALIKAPSSHHDAAVRKSSPHTSSPIFTSLAKMHIRTSSLIAAPLLASSAYATTCSGSGSDQIKNFIYVVPDGFGHASQTMARDYYSLMNGNKNISQPMSMQLPHDKLVLGSVRTQATDDLVTDSAAAATAFASGFKSYNGGTCSPHKARKLWLTTSQPLAFSLTKAQLPLF